MERSVSVVLDEGACISVYITSVKCSLGVCRFWAQCDTSSATQFQTLMDNCQQFIENASCVVNERSLDIGDLCFAKYSDDSKWYRGRICGCCTTKGYFNVNFIDYGNSERIPFSDIRFVEDVMVAGPSSTQPAQEILFGTPALVTECILANIEPVGEWDWDEAAVSYLTECLEYEEFTGTVLKASGNAVLVQLNFSNGGSVADQMVQLGFGKSCDNSHILLDTFKRLELPVGYEDDVCMACCISPELFWVYLKSAPIDEMTAKVSTYYSGLREKDHELQPIRKGTPCIVKYSGDEGFYRAEVVEVLDYEKCRVQFVDFGDSEITSFSNIREVHYSFLQTPVGALECALDGVSSLTKEAAVSLARLTVDKNVKAVVDSKNQNKLFVHLYHVHDNTAVDIADIMVREKLVEYSPAEPRCKQIKLETLQLKLWSYHSVYVTHVDDPFNITCQLASSTGDIDAIMSELATACGQGNTTSLQSYEIMTRFVCCAKYAVDGEWYRAEITKIVDVDKVEVKYIDFGNKEIVSISQLQPLPDNCCQPVQGISCNLAYVKPSAGGWSKAEKDWLLDASDGFLLIAYIIGIDKNGRYLVELSESQNVINMKMRERWPLKNQISDITAEAQKVIEKVESPVVQKEETKHADHVQKTVNHAPEIVSVELKQPDIQPGTRLSVLVTTVITVSSFYCQLTNHIDLLQDKLQKFYTALTPSDLRFTGKSVYCCARFTEDDSWYRAQIVKTDKTEVEVLYVDYGNSEKLPISRLKQLTAEFAVDPVQSVLCSLTECVYRSLASIPPENIATEFQKLVSHREMCAVVLSKVLDGRLVVELIDSELGLDIGSKLVESFGLQRAGTPPSLQMKKSPTIVRFSESDERQLSPVPIDLDFQKMKMKVGCREEVLVTHCSDPEHIWFQVLEYDADLGQLMVDIDKYCTGTSRGNNSVACGLGVICLAQYTEDDQWYRAVITGVRKKGDVEVQFVDYGNTEMLLQARLKPITKQFLDLPAQAVRCSIMRDVQTTNINWSPEQIKQLQDMILNKVFTVSITQHDEVEDAYYVELYDEAQMCINRKFKDSCMTHNKMLDKPQSAVTKLVANGYHDTQTKPPTIDQPSKKTMSSVMRCEMETPYIQQILEEGSYYDVLVSYINSPSQFWCQMWKHVPELDILMDQIAEVYSNRDIGDLAITTPHVGQKCCGQFTEDDGWYRAQIVAIDGENLTLMYVDYGNSETLHIQRVKKLKPDFVKFPAQAFVCRLDGLKPAHATWSLESVQNFESLTGEKRLVANVVKVEKCGRVMVDLIDTNGTDDLSIKDVLVANQHGVSTSPDIPKSSKSSGILSPIKAAQVTSNTCTPTGTTKSANSILTPATLSKVTPDVRCPTESRAKDSANRVVPPISPGPLVFQEINYKKDEVISVTVTYINSPAEFWCQPIRTSDQFNALMDNLESYYAKLGDSEGILTQTTVGKQCVAQYSVDNGWYRAVIVARQPGKMKAFFIDYGNTELITANKVKEIQPAFTELPAQAFQCCLSGFSEVEDKTEFDALVGNGDPLNCKVTKCDFGLYDVSLSNAANKDIGEVLRENLKKGKQEVVSPVALKITKLSLPACDDLQLGEYHDLMVSHVESPLQFWCNQVRQSTQLDQLVSEMTSHYDQRRTTSLDDLKPGEVCAALYTDESWYRAIVKDISHTNDITVFFCDFGNTEVVPGKSVKALDIKFSHFPVQAIECGLQGVGDSTNAMTETFQEMTAEKHLVAKALKKEGLKILVELYDTTGEIDVNINKELGILQKPDIKSISTSADSVAVSVTKFPQRAVTIGRSEEGYVSYIESVNKFYVQLVTQEEALGRMMNDLESQCSNSTNYVTELKCGMPCCAKYSADGAWYRAEVVEITGDQVKVLFVDYGNTETIVRSEVKMITPQLCSLPPFSIECKLDIDSIESITEVYNSFSELTLEKTLSVTFLNSDQPCKVTLIHENQNINEEIVKRFQPVVEAPAIIETSHVKPQPTNATQKEIMYPSRELETGCPIDGYVSYIESAKKFYIQLACEEERLGTLMSDVEAEYSTASKDAIIELKCGMPCCAKYSTDGAWYRAEVVEITGDQVKVLFVDYGNTETIVGPEVKMISPQLCSLPPFSIECKLDIDRIESTTEVYNCFSELTLEKTLSVTFLNSDQPCKVTLIHENQNINEEIVKRFQPVVEAPAIIETSHVKPQPTNATQKEIMYPSRELETGCPIDGYVSYIESAKKFYIQLACEEERLGTLMSDVEAEYSTASKDAIIELKCGMPCCAKYSADGAWYRAEVVEITGDQVKVLFVDYGNTETIVRSEVKLITPQLCSLPPFSIECKLDIDRIESTTEVYNSFSELTLEKTLSVTFLNSDQPCKVTLIHENQNIKDTIVKRFQPVVETPAPKQIQEPQVAQSYASRTVETGLPIDGYVSYIESTKKFYIQLACEEERLGTLMSDVDAEYSTASKETIIELKCGMPCCTKYSDGAWYRAEVVEITGDKVKVLFVDYGNTETIVRSEVKMITPQLCSLPPFSIECMLDISSIDSSPDVYTHFSALTLEKTLSVLFLDEQHPYRVSLNHDNQNINRKMADKFYSPNDENKLASHEDRFTKMVFQVGQVEEVFISSVVCPWNFHCQLANAGTQLTDLMEEIQAYSTNVENESAMEVVMVQMPCLALFSDGQWYRGSIAEIHESSYSIYFVDYGNSQECSFKDVRAISIKFLQLEEQAIACCLSGVQKKSNTWPHEAEVRFEELVLEKSLTAKVVASGIESLDVDLFDEEISVSEQMLVEGLVERRVIKDKETSLENHTNKDDAGESHEVHLKEEDGCLDLEKQILTAEGDEETVLDTAVIEASGEKESEQPTLEDLAGQPTPEEPSGSQEEPAGSQEVLPSDADLGKTGLINKLQPLPASVPELSFSIAEMELGGSEEVYVIKVVSAPKIYCQLSRLSLVLQSLSVTLQDDYSKIEIGELLMAELEVGTPCMVLSMADAQWKRAITTGIIDDSNVEVFFVDYGNTAVVPADHLRLIKLEYLKIPAMAIKCYIREIIQSGTISSSNITSLLHDQLNGKPFTAKVLQQPYTGVYLVELYDKGTNVGQSFLDSIKPTTEHLKKPVVETHIIEFAQSPAGKEKGKCRMVSNDAQSPDLNTGIVDVQPNMPLDELLSYPQPDRPLVYPAKEELLKSVVSHLMPDIIGSDTQLTFLTQMSPSNFICQFAETAEELKTVTQKVNDFCNGKHSTVLNEPLPGTPCLAQFPHHGPWYRAVIIAISDVECEVYFMDYANTETVPLTHLRIIPSEMFEVTAQALKFCLADVQPIDNDWTDDAKTLFEEWCKDKLLTARVVSISSDKKVQVKLYDVNNTDISKILISKNYAKPLGAVKKEPVTLSESANQENIDEKSIVDAAIALATVHPPEGVNYDEDISGEEIVLQMGNVSELEVAMATNAKADGCQSDSTAVQEHDVWGDSDDRLLDTTQETIPEALQSETVIEMTNADKIALQSDTSEDFLEKSDVSIQEKERSEVKEGVKLFGTPQSEDFLETEQTGKNVESKKAEKSSGKEGDKLLDMPLSNWSEDFLETERAGKNVESGKNGARSEIEDGDELCDTPQSNCSNDFLESAHNENKNVDTDTAKSETIFETLRSKDFLKADVAANENVDSEKDGEGSGNTEVDEFCEDFLDSIDDGTLQKKLPDTRDWAIYEDSTPVKAIPKINIISVSDNTNSCDISDYTEDLEEDSIEGDSQYVAMETKMKEPDEGIGECDTDLVMNTMMVEATSQDVSTKIEFGEDISSEKKDGYEHLGKIDSRVLDGAGDGLCTDKTVLETDVIVATVDCAGDRRKLVKLIPEELGWTESTTSLSDIRKLSSLEMAEDVVDRSETELPRGKTSGDSGVSEVPGEGEWSSPGKTADAEMMSLFVVTEAKPGDISEHSGVFSDENTVGDDNGQKKDPKEDVPAELMRTKLPLQRKSRASTFSLDDWVDINTDDMADTDTEDPGEELKNEWKSQKKKGQTE
uniref:Uncharacterized protein LOC100376221 n=1 Tax=Saccoglossus kowalevskii TaxID=10224 RepID=A0ABM0GTH0_SACKO|nr:PREDICTED: uncharacterized protein LOC100376221 [Saccoglossus kowalevskii]